VPPLQLTEEQPPPIAANGGLSYTSFDRDGNAGTAAATEAALRQIAEGERQALIEMLENARPGPIETKWGVGFVATQSVWNIFGRTTSKPLKAA
jgi:hypothetical protein